MDVSFSLVLEFAVPVACIVAAAGVGAVLEFVVDIASRRARSCVVIRGLRSSSMRSTPASCSGPLRWVCTSRLRCRRCPTMCAGCHQTLLILVCASVTIVAARFVGNAVLRLSRGPGQQIASGTLFASVSQALIVVLGALFTLSALGIAVTPLLTALGVGGLAVALALQPPLANLFFGNTTRCLAADTPGRLHRVAEWTTRLVEDINWRSISIRESTNSLVVVPNAVLAQEIFTNYRLPEPRVAARVPLRVAYGSDIGFVEQLALEAVAMVGEDIKNPGTSRDAFVRVHEFARRPSTFRSVSS